MGIWVGRYAMAAGQVREDGPWLVDRRRQHEDAPVRLVVLTEPVDERSAEFCSEVAEAVAELFARESLSITGGLLRALRQTHANLAEWNRRSLREHRVAVGVTCVAIRDAEAVVAQVGPGLVYVYGIEGLRRLAAEGEAALPLGATEAIEPQFFSTRLDAHQLLLLTSTVEEPVGVSAIADALAGGPDRTLADLFVRTRHLRDLTAVLIADVPGLEEESDAPPAPVEGLSDPYEPEPEPPPIDSGGPVGSGAPEPRERSGGWASSPAAGHTRPGPAAGAGAGGERSVRSGDGTPSGLGAAPAAERSRTAGSRSRGLPSMPRLRQAPPVRRAGSGGSGEWARRARPIALGVMVALLLGLLAWCAVPPLLDEDRGQELDTLLTTVETQITSAEQSPDPVERRAVASAALASLAQARALNPEDPRLAPLSGRLQVLLDALDAIVEVGDLRSVLTFEGAVTAPFSPRALVAGGGELWLVDGDRGRVLRVDPVGGVEPEEVYLPGESYGATDEDPGVTAGEAAFVAWDEPGGRLLVLDRERQLFAITPGAIPEPLAIRDATEWQGVAGIAAYDGNLYILDPEGGEVWRYLPAGDGYDSERDGLLGGIDLDGATALAVAGDVLIVSPDSVRRFSPGTEQGGQLLGIDRPQRIVAADRGGLFIRQYRHPEFFDLRGLALAPDGATLFVLTGQGIHAFAVDTTAAAAASPGNATPAPSPASDFGTPTPDTATSGVADVPTR